MKWVSTVALGAALALGAVVVFDGGPALAREKKEKPASFDLSGPVREAVGAAQAALAKKDYATAQAELDKATAASSKPDDKYVIDSVLYDLGRTTNDTAKQAQAIEGMLASGKVEPAKQGQFYLVAGNLAYQAKNYKHAETLLDQAIAAGGAPIEAYALDAEAKNSNGNPTGAVNVIVAAAAAQKAAGQKLPEDYYGRAIAIGYKAQLAPQVQKLSEDRVTYYPSLDTWRDALIIYRDLNHVDAEQELDIDRLLRTIGALKGEADYYTYAQQLYLKYPGEAKAVIEEGVAKGYLNPTPGSNIKDMLDTATKRVAADKKDLATADTVANKAADGKAAFGYGNAFLGYGDWAKAAQMYKIAAQKGGVDANMLNTRLGMALFRSGDVAGAKEAFGKVGGARAGLATYWGIWMNHPSVAAAAAAPSGS